MSVFGFFTDHQLDRFLDGNHDVPGRLVDAINRDLPELFAEGFAFCRV